MEDIFFMQRCLELARNGSGLTSPNPMVGSVVVHNGRIIGEGWHHKAGEAHAEVNAIESVKNRELLSSSTIYVNLEPCSHFGKTPPCADLIIASGIPKVVVGNLDPHEAVAGKGIERLRNAGVEVITGVMENEGRYLNRRFFKVHQEGRPYVILKWAQSRDGFLDKDRANAETGINWITAPETQTLVHQWRAQEDAIMIGGSTLRNDNPRLNNRLYAGKAPRPVVVTSGKSLHSQYHLLNNPETLILTDNPNLRFSNLQTIHFPTEQHHALNWVKSLLEFGINSVMVEGGAQLLNSFLENDIWDEARVLTGTPVFGSGLKAPVVNARPGFKDSFGHDLLEIYYR